MSDTRLVGNTRRVLGYALAEIDRFKVARLQAKMRINIPGSRSPAPTAAPERAYVHANAKRNCYTRDVVSCRG
jgi:hypothetical protein